MAADTPVVVAVAEAVALVVEPTRVAGVAIAAGGQGPPGRDGAPGGTTFEWTQDIPLAVWTVPHNRGRFPSVTVVDHLGNRVEPDVTYIDQNIVQITHGRPEIGRAYFN